MQPLYVTMLKIFILLFRSSTAIARIMGLVILVVAVQFILEGARAFFMGRG